MRIRLQIHNSDYACIPSYIPSIFILAAGNTDAIDISVSLNNKTSITLLYYNHMEYGDGQCLMKNLLEGKP